MADDEKQDAFIRQLEIIGEAVGRINSIFRAAHPDLVQWPTVKSMRNLLIHGCGVADLDEVWTAVIRDRQHCRTSYPRGSQLRAGA